MERWKINLYTLWVTQVFSLMGFGFCIPFIPFLFQEMGVTDPAELSYYVGLSTTLPAATMAVAAPIWGFLSDRYGRKMMIMRSMFCAALLLALMGLAQTVWQFMLLRALQGILSGTVTASMTFVSANTPERRMSYALGLMTSSNFLGYSVGPFFGGILAEFLGYRICFGIGGALMMTGFFLVVVLLKEDKNSYGYRIKTEKNPGGRHLKAISPFVLFILISLLFQRVVRSVFAPFIPLYVQETLGTMAGAATYTGIISAASGLATAVAALTVAKYADRYDKMRLALLLTALSLPVTVLLPVTHSISAFLAVNTLFFFLVGGAEPIMSSAASERTPAAQRGSLFGMIGTVGSLGAMVSPMIGSWLSAEYSLGMILVAMPVFTLIQWICMIFASRKQNTSPVQNEGSEKK